MSSLIPLGSSPITAIGPGTVNLTQIIPIFGSMITSQFSYVVVWITGLTTTTPVVVPMNGGSSSGTGAGTGGLSSLTGSGFTVAPQLYTGASGKMVTFTPGVTGTVKYFFTSATTQYDAASFQSMYAYLGSVPFATGAQAGSVTVQAGMTGMIPVNATATGYLWIMVDAGVPYTPVRVMLG